jgi:hypothetical protein
MGNVDKSKENLSKCICRECPSYTFACKVKPIPDSTVHMIRGDISKANHIEGLFCAFGMSTYIADRKGCICGKCKVYSENKLSGSYYCLAENGK